MLPMASISSEKERERFSAERLPSGKPDFPHPQRGGYAHEPDDLLVAQDFRDGGMKENALSVQYLHLRLHLSVIDTLK